MEKMPKEELISIFLKEQSKFDELSQKAKLAEEHAIKIVFFNTCFYNIQSQNKQKQKKII